jgi:hypothetical protein
MSHPVVAFVISILAAPALAVGPFVASGELPAAASSPRALARGGDIWVGVSADGSVVRRVDGWQWEHHRTDDTSAVRDVLWHQDRFLAVGPSTAQVSTDGRTWTSISEEVPELRAIASSGDDGVIVGVGSNGTVATSVDGATWVEHAPPLASTLVDVAWNGSIFVAVSADGQAAVSTDGASWDVHDVVEDSLVGVAANPMRLVAVGGSVFSRILSSPDGQTWVSELEGAGGRDWMSAVAADPNGFAAGGAIFADETVPKLSVSNDGEAWSSASINWRDASGQVAAIGAGGDEWLVVASSGHVFATVAHPSRGISRSFVNQAYVPGMAFEVHLSSQADTSDDWTIDELPPAAWSVVDAGDGSVGQDGVLRFSGTGISSDTVLVYSVSPPADAYGPAVFSGSATIAGVTAELLGEREVEDAANAAARALHTVWWLPVAAHLDGAHGSRWRTDLTLSNLDTTAVDLALRLRMPDGSMRAVTNRIEAGAQGVWTDVLASAFGVDGKAPVEIRADGPLHGVARVYNLASDGSSFGQAMPVLHEADALPRQSFAHLDHLRQVEGEWRTNLTLFNSTGSDVSAEVRLLATDGTELASYELDLGPFETVQDLEPFKRRAARPDVGWGRAEISSAWNGVMVSASVIDSRTNDATTILRVVTPGVRVLSAACSSQLSGTITSTDPVDGPAGRGFHSDFASLFVLEDRTIDLLATHEFGYGRLDVVGPNGEVVASTSAGGWQRTDLSFTTELQGDHLIWITTAEPGGTGSWRLTITCNRGDAADVHGRMAVRNQQLRTATSSKARSMIPGGRGPASGWPGPGPAPGPDPGPGPGLLRRVVPSARLMERADGILHAERFTLSLAPSLRACRASSRYPSARPRISRMPDTDSTATSSTSIQGDSVGIGGPGW